MSIHGDARLKYINTTPPHAPELGATATPDDLNKLVLKTGSHGVYKLLPQQLC